MEWRASGLSLMGRTSERMTSAERVDMYVGHWTDIVGGDDGGESQGGRGAGQSEDSEHSRD